MAITCLLLTIASFFFFYIDPTKTEISTLSLHDALPISEESDWRGTETDGRSILPMGGPISQNRENRAPVRDRKSTRLNSSHVSISYAVFCLKKKTGHSNRENKWKHFLQPSTRRKPTSSR